MLLHLAVYANAAPPDLLTQWSAVADRVTQSTPVPVPFGPDDINAINASRPTARRFDTPEGAYATGAIWIDAPPESVWVILNDGPHEPPGRIALERLPAPPGIRRVHMTLDLPIPLSDRQWVTDVQTNTGLYGATGGKVWQRHWDIADPAFALHPSENASWIGETRGAWTVFPADEGTLLLFSVRTVLGGAIPASIAQAWAVSTIKSSLQRVGERAVALPGHYRSGHEVVIGPDGTPIPFFP